jgi:hypothetical protein
MHFIARKKQVVTSYGTSEICVEPREEVMENDKSEWLSGQQGIVHNHAARNSRSFDSSVLTTPAAKSESGLHHGHRYKLDDPPIIDQDSSKAHAYGAISSSKRSNEGAKTSSAFAQGDSWPRRGNDDAAKSERRSVSERLEILAREAYGGYTPLK